MAPNAPQSHPYYPSSIKIPNYVPNDIDVVTILVVFFGAVALLLGLTWFFGSSRRVTISERLQMCWFALCGGIHLTLEGYWSLNNRTFAGKGDFLAELWKEYSKSDSRYITSDPFTVCMETITAFVWGPCCLLIAFAVAYRRAWRHFLIVVVSLGQLYGTVLYMAIEVMDEFKHGPFGHPLYFWFYFITLNSFWFVIPVIMILIAMKSINAGQELLDKQRPPPVVTSAAPKSFKLKGKKYF